MLTVEPYEVIRRMVRVEEMSQRAVAKELHHSRRTVKKALEYAVPPGYRREAPRARPVLEPVQALIEGWLEADRQRPRKQRHTAQRIYERLRDEHQFTGSYSPVQRFVAEWQRRQGLLTSEVFVPLVFAPGEEAQVDWGEGTVLIGGRERVLQFFCVRFAFSRAVYVRAYERQDQVSFLDAHVRAFEYFGGVPRRIAYDNLKTAVIRVGRGRERELNAKFLELRSWYLFDTRFCNVASGNEKGHVENLVKRVQRTFLTPLPEVSSLAELNQQLERDCQRELDQTTRDPRGGEKRTSRELFAAEKAQLLPLPERAFAACVEVTTRVDKFSTVRFDNCSYSVPVEHAYQQCVVRGYLDRIEILCEHECVATHARGTAAEKTVAEQYVLEPRHYLPLLARKPGLLHNGRPFQGEPFGPDFALLRRELEYRYTADGTKQYLRVLLLLTKHPEADVCAAVARCVALRAFNADAIESALRNAPLDLPPSRLDFSDRPELANVGNGIRLAADYDRIVAAQREPQVENAQVENAQVENAQVENAQVENAQVENARDENAREENAREENARCAEVAHNPSYECEEIVAAPHPDEPRSLTVAAPDHCPDMHSDDSRINDPLVDDPLVNDPLVNDPLVNDPLVNDPLVNDPLVNDPLVDDPHSDDPHSDEPRSDEPRSDEPRSDEPRSLTVAAPDHWPDPCVNDPHVNDPHVNRRGTGTAPLAKTFVETFASSIDALALCCPEMESDPVPITEPIARKEEAA